MICVVSITEDGAVTVQIDTDESEADETAALAGLVLEDILDRASKTAIDTWLRLNGDDDTTGAGE